MTVVFTVAFLGLGAVVFLATPRRVPAVRPAPSRAAMTGAAVSGIWRAPGRLEARTTVRVGATIGGQVVEVKIAAGDRVRRGQVLARLDDLEQRRKVDVERALLQLAELKGVHAEKRFVELVQSLQGDGILPGDINSERIMNGELGDAQLGVLATSTQVTAQQSAVALAREALARRLVRAPSDGVILDAGVASGETVGPSPPGPPLFVIDAEPTALVLRVDLDELHCAKVAPGPVSFRIAAFGNRTFRGTVRPVTVSRREILIDIVSNEDAVLRPGMSALVSLPMMGAPATVSSDAVARR